MKPNANMKPIDNTTGLGRVVSTLVGQTAETLTKTLAAKLAGRPRRAPKRRRAGLSAGPKRSQPSAPGMKKGGLRHG